VEDIEGLVRAGLAVEDAVRAAGKLLAGVDAESVAISAS
jgi:hypothetical protein